MTVNVRGGFDVAVTQPLLHILERKTHAQQIAGRAVPQLMETNLRQPMLFEKLLKLVCHIIRWERSAITPAKHIVTFVISVAEKLFVFLLLGLQLQQEFFIPGVMGKERRLELFFVLSFLPVDEGLKIVLVDLTKSEFLVFKVGKTKWNSA